MASSRRIALVAAIILAAIVSGGCSSTHKPSGSTARLSQQLDHALRRGETGSAHYTARVVDLETGKELYAVDRDKPFIPASNGKLAVGAATLDRLGADDVFKTYLATDGDDLWLIGTGDPGIGDSMLAKKSGGTTMTVLDQWAEELKRRGVTHIQGNLIYDDRAFDDQLTCPSWSESYITDWYAAPIAGLNFNTNCIDVKLTPTTDGQPTEYSVIPPTKGVVIKNKSLTGQGEAPAIERERSADIFTVTGATTKPAELESKAITNPGRFFADALRTHLASKGIVIDGDIKRADHPLGGSRIPPANKVVAVHETKLTDALHRINKNSQNNFAEAFCKMLGAAHLADQGHPGPGSWAAGAAGVKTFLERNKIDTSKLVIVDGSGLSRQNRVTSHMITDLLKVMWKHRDHEAFFDSLSISGTDGTIASRMKDLKGRVHAKTGYIGGVRALSGYIQTDSGKWLAFSIIFNGIDGSVKPYEALQDNACRVLAAWPKEIELPTSRPTTAEAK